MLGMVWMCQASLLFCAFFLLGKLIKPYLLEMGRWPIWKVILGIFVAMIVCTIGVTQNTFNQPPDGSFFKAFIGGEMIVISTGQYGQYGYFILSTFGAAGTLLCLARLLPVTKLMRECGDYSLVLLGLNGIFLHILNPRLTQWLTPEHDSAIVVTLYAMVIGGISMLLCLPVAKLLDQYLPQLTGRPMLKGPLLPALYRQK